MDAIEGRVLHKRSVSKRLLFVDIQHDHQRVTSVFKIGVCSEDLIFKAQKTSNKIHVGDIVQVQGKLNEGEMLVEDFKVVQRWSDVSEGAFQPVPPPSTSQGKLGEGVCKFWNNTGQCPKGKNCKYPHEKVDTAHDHQERSRHSRARVFAQWIANTFPDIEEVYDVAGGKGDLAFELGLRKGLKCIVVDPRNPAKFESMSLPRWQRKILAANPGFKLDHRQTVFSRDFCETIKDKKCLVIGMHPDQATEPIVDLSLEFNKPFAVVPCCVFAHENPERRLQDGREPRSYEQFCQYLQEKNGNIKADTLDFKGRNVVLFCVENKVKVRS